MKVAIIDDEKHASETLLYQLNKLGFTFDRIDTFQDSVEAVDALRNSPPDLLFLDIEMPGLNGFQFLEKLGTVEISIIFTTAYSKFAVDAFRVNAVDYLIKPISISELEEAVSRAMRKHMQSEKIKKVFHQFENRKTAKSKVALPSVKGIEFMDTKDIIFCQGERNYTRIFLEDGSKKLASKTLKEIGQQLPENQFFRIHHSCIANLLKVTGYIHSDGGVLILNGKHELKIARSRKKELLERLEDL